MEIFGAVVTCVVVFGMCVWAFCYIGRALDPNGINAAALACVFVCMCATVALLISAFVSRLTELHPASEAPAATAEKPYIPLVQPKPPKPPDHGRDGTT